MVKGLHHGLGSPELWHHVYNSYVLYVQDHTDADGVLAVPERGSRTCAWLQSWSGTPHRLVPSVQALPRELIQLDVILRSSDKCLGILRVGSNTISAVFSSIVYMLCCLGGGPAQGSKSKNMIQNLKRKQGY